MGFSSINSTDLVVEILKRLPLKSVIRFKCVCRAWKDLISDDYVQRSLPLIMAAICYVGSGEKSGGGENSKKKPRLAWVSGDGLEYCDLGFFPHSVHSSIVDCCNGLLLCYSPTCMEFYVCDPVAKRWAAVVAPPPRRRQVQLSILAFDPKHSQEYKVVCFTAWRPRGAELEVFSSEIGGWVEREVHWGIDTETLSASMHYAAGVLSILATDHLVCVELGTMSCRRTALPEPLRHDGRVGSSGGRLCYAAGADAGGGQLRIWVLEDLDSGKWLLKHRLVINSVPRFDSLAFHPAEEDLVYMAAAGKVVGHDLRRRRSEVVCEFMERVDVIQICMFPFSDCLAKC